MQPQLQLKAIEDWLPKAGKPVIISGPCSAESGEQVMSTALAIAKSGKVHVLRAGIWKPRTHPNSFEGAGTIGLKWLKAAGEATELPVATEVANAGHVEACLKNKIDILWIGARTTVNPFYVQEIADALKGVDIPVMVKNPVNPDIQLWAGALERINQAGIEKLVAIHRGFSPFGKSTYRNTPDWGLPIELKTLFPGLPVICDPSHISGDRALIFEVAQKALDLDMDGLMIEAHCNPDEALSDARQQVTPDRLVQLLCELTVRSPHTENIEFTNRLQELRQLIDEIDTDLLGKLMKRMKVVEEIGEYKLENNVTILQLERWKEILTTRVAKGTDIGLQEDFVRKLLQIIHRESIRRQTAIMNQQPAG